jgi:hypothetical protein
MGRCGVWMNIPRQKLRIYDIRSFSRLPRASSNKTSTLSSLNFCKAKLELLDLQPFPRDPKITRYRYDETSTSFNNPISTTSHNAPSSPSITFLVYDPFKSENTLHNSPPNRRQYTPSGASTSAPTMASQPSSSNIPSLHNSLSFQRPPSWKKSDYHWFI